MLVGSPRRSLRLFRNYDRTSISGFYALLSTASQENSHSLDLLQHPYFTDINDAEATMHLGLFVGKYSKWRAQGLPWRLYNPNAWFGGNVGREIGCVEALNRLSKGDPVRFQRMRVFTVIPDLKALEAIASNVAVPALKGLAQASKAAKTAQVQADPEGLEIKFGLPATLHSFAELKLFSSIYNLEVPIAPFVEPSGWMDDDDPIRRPINDQTEIAEHISKLMNRSLDSGVDFFSEETSIARRFWYHMRRQTLFWTPLSIAVIASLLSSPVSMGLVGLEPMLFAVDLLSETVAEANIDDAASGFLGELLQASTDTALGLACGIGFTFTFLRCGWLAIFTPLGFRLSAYTAFMRVARSRPIIVQEVKMHTLRVPFLTTLSWFSNYRPGDRCASAEDLSRFSNMYLSKYDKQ